MTVIKNLAFLDKKKLKNLNSFVEAELDLSVFHSFPTDFLHHFLPFKLKFLEESFVAIENKKITGLITLQKVGEKRVKISRLLLEENSMEIGKLLVNCVMTIFLSKGAESFYVVTNKMNSSLITMFKEGLGFQKFAKETVYKVQNCDITDEFDVNFEHIRKMKLKDTKEVVKLINETMLSYRRPFFSKNSSYMKKTFFNGGEKFVVLNDNGDKILGYFIISKLQCGNYLLDFVINKGYEGFSSDIINFATFKLIKTENFQNLYVKLKSYYMNFEELNAIVKMEHETMSENEILVKDFMIAKKQEFHYEKMIFNDATPAY